MHDDDIRVETIRSRVAWWCESFPTKRPSWVDDLGFLLSVIDTMRSATPEPPQVDAEPIIGPMCSRCGTELASDNVKCCEPVDAGRCEAHCVDGRIVNDDCSTAKCLACNGTGRKGER